MKITLMSSGTVHSPLTHTIVALGKELVKNGHQVTMIAPSMDKYSKWQLDRVEQIDGIRVVYPRQFKSHNLGLSLLPYVISAALYLIQNPTDVIYVYKPNPATIVGVLAKWLHKAKMVVHLDDLDAEVMRAEGQPMVLWAAVAACNKLASRNADGFVTASRLLQQQVLSSNPRAKAIRIPNGVDITQFPLAPKSQPGSKPRLIYFGILGRTRIVAPLLQALPLVTEALGPDSFEMEILGDGPRRTELEGLAMKLGVDHLVHFRGWTTYDQLPKYAARGDIGLCMMPYERTTAACSNQKVFQYMALGLASIVSRVGDLPLYVKEGRAGVVVPDKDIPRLAQAMIALLTDPAKRSRLAARGRDLAETDYSWSNLAAELEQFLNDISSRSELSRQLLKEAE